MQDVALYQQLLGLASPWRVESVELKIKQQEVEVVAAYDPATTWACPECRQAMGVHDHVERRWRHLDSCQFRTMVRARVPRVRCSEHGVVTPRQLSHEPLEHASGCFLAIGGRSFRAAFRGTGSREFASPTS